LTDALDAVNHTAAKVAPARFQAGRAADGPFQKSEHNRIRLVFQGDGEPAMNEERACVKCGAAFVAHNVRAKYCSARCNFAAFRARHA
jgi:hypothetical protein